MTANIQFSGIIFFWATERKLTFTAKTVSCLATTVNNKVHYLTVNILEKAAAARQKLNGN